ncbi:acetoacetate decarboxylase family protein [Micromonospora globbae]|uniref:Acetoacetate decarboxylase family protein n=1 Tax=Micromonospora globbae TaxID=1894969 RepID=A0ABZ1SCK1_9ACTN|nr:acetoacetate decarboxylase family protein [Micromonospora globbae]
MRLRGFTNPLSPTGSASLVEPPPHHIGSDAIRVLFRAGADLARRYLPEPLEPVDDGVGFAFVADMVKVSDSDPDQAFTAPRRTQYGEGIIGFYATHRGEPGRFSAFIWVTEDWSMGFGTVMGWGKKIGEVRRTHINPYNPAMGPIGPGTKLSGSVTRLGEPVLDLGIEITEAIEASAMPAYGNRGFLLSHQPSPSPTIPTRTRLLGLQLANVRTGEVFRGNPHLKIHDAVNEDLAPLRDVEPFAAYAFKQGWTTDTTAEVLHDYTPEQPAESLDRRASTGATA